MGEERLEEIKMSHKMLKTPEARQEARAILSSHPDYCFPRRDSHWAETAAAMLG